MTKDTGDLTQFNTVACREYTHPREDEASQPKGWIQGDTIIGPVLEVATRYLHGKYGVEIRIWSLNEDNTHSWVRISHGSNKFVMYLNNNDTEIPEDQPDEHVLQLNAKEFAYRSKAKAKSQRREPVGSSSWTEGIGLLLNQGNSLSPSTRFRRKAIHLLRHSQKVHREEDGAVQFWRIKSFLQNPFAQSIHWSDDRWKVCLAAGGGAKRRFQYCTDDSGIIIYFRALQGHTGRNLIDPSLQDTVIVPSNVFQHIYHIDVRLIFNLSSTMD